MAACDTLGRIEPASAGRRRTWGRQMVRRLYTGRGDQGETDLLGERVGKDDPRIEILGTLDEATSSIGLGRALATTERAKALLIEVQRDLYKIMAELAFTDELRPAGYVLAEERVAWLAQLTDDLTAEVDLPPQFILPGETVPGAALDVARTVVRRGERVAVALHHAGHLENVQILRYLNRLSSFLFILARFEERAAGATALKAKGPTSRQAR
jgi:cob(I)alamin adenosyltransferase